MTNDTSGTSVGPDDQPRTDAIEHYRDEKVPLPNTGHTWGSTVTSLIGPTPETEGAVDVDEDRVQAHRAVARQLEEAIVAVASAHGAGASREVLRDALQRELEARGRWPQPETWVDAVASDIEAGGLYQMGTAVGTQEGDVEVGEAVNAEGSRDDDRPGGH